MTATEADARERVPGEGQLGPYSAVDIVCATLVVLSICDISLGAVIGTSPTLAPLIACVPVGLFLLVRDAIGGDRASRFGVAFLAAGLVSVALCASPWAAFAGAIVRQTSWLVYAGGLAAFALGRRVTAPGGRLVAVALVCATVVSGAAGLLQVVVEPSDGAFELFRGRPRGLSLHPVYLAQFAAGACALGCRRVAKRGDALGFVVVACMSFVVGLAASRVALMAVIVVVLATMLVGRRVRRVWALPIAAALGVITSWGVHAVTATSQSVVDRGDASGLRDRWDAWRIGLRGWVERPLFGAGPGRFSVATQGHFTERFAARSERVWWADAHNVFVEVLVSWGAISLIAFVGFVLLVGRSARGPMAWVAATAASSWLLQPVVPGAIAVVGVAVGIALGVSANADVRASDPSRPSAETVQTSAVGALAAIGIAVGLLIMVGGVRTRLPDGSTTELPSGWSIWYRDDWGVAAGNAGLAPTDRDDVGVKLFWARRAVELEPEHPVNQLRLAELALLDGDLELARNAAERTLELQPSRSSATVLLRLIDEAESAESG